MTEDIASSPHAATLSRFRRRPFSESSDEWTTYKPAGPPQARISPEARSAEGSPVSRVSDATRRIRARAVMASLACAVVVLATTAQSARAHDADEAALGSLVDAELAFARMGLARGVREAFLANFADDGIVFEPAPVKLREAWRARPKPADPLAVKLEWAPVNRSTSSKSTFTPSSAANSISGRLVVEAGW